MANATYRQKPAIAAAEPNPRLTKDRRFEIVSDVPHEELIASASISIPLHEQVENLNRLGRIKRQQALSDLFPEDYYGEDFADDFDDVGMTEHELAGLSTAWPDQLKHEVPEPVSGREEPTKLENSTPKEG